MTLRKAWIQRALGYLVFIPFSGTLIAFMVYGLGYRIRDLAAIRREFRELTRDGRPLLVCANHLTYLDPVLLINAFANHWWYAFNFRCLSWNLPANEYKGRHFFRIVCQLNKCIFIDRQGTREHHASVLGVARQLLAKGEVLTIFPEGRRSRTGRFDQTKLAYGIGKIVSELDECRVLCVYLRADGQAAKGGFPRRGARFTLMREVIEFSPPPRGRAGTLAITRQIAGVIQGLEDRYFAAAENAGTLPASPSLLLSETRVAESSTLGASVSI